MELSFHTQLEELGLTKNEAIVYVAVLELGEPGIGEIESHTGLHKQLIYNAVEKLQGQGLMTISYIRQRRRFAAVHPSVIEEQLEAKLVRTKALVSELQKIENNKRVSDQTRIYKGAKGIQQYYIESVRKQPIGQPVFIIDVGSKRYFEIFKPEEYGYQTFERIRTERKVTMQLVLFAAKEVEFALNKGRPFFDLRLLDMENHAPIALVIWHDRVGLLFYTAEPYLLDIIGKDTVDGFEQYFQVLWRQAKKVL